MPCHDIAWWYLIGEVIGALFFGRMSDKLGRKNLFMITLGVYLVGSGLTALTPAGGHWFIFLYATRVIAGMGIGGEYAAINSAIDEMIPAKYRGRVDLAVNGTYWAGAFLGTIVTIVALNHITPVWGWRVAFLVGPVLALVIIFVRRHLPESPRWQIMHGRQQAAEGSISEIEHDVAATKGDLPPVDPSREIEIRPTDQIGYLALLRVLFRHYPSRSILGAALMITQSFLYNAIFFTYGLVLLYFFKVPATDTAYYFMAFAVGNLLGPLTLGRLFDTVGRRKMISGTYILSGILLAISAELFRVGALNAVTQTICWTVVFFFASAGASAGYLTVERDLPAGGAGEGHRRVLRYRAVLRRVRLALVRPPDRQRHRPEHAVRRLHRRRGCDDPRRRRSRSSSPSMPRASPSRTSRRRSRSSRNRRRPSSALASTARASTRRRGSPRGYGAGSPPYRKS